MATTNGPERVPYTFADGRTADVSPKAAAIYARRDLEAARISRARELRGEATADAKPTTTGSGLSRADVRAIVREEIAKIEGQIDAAVKAAVDDALAAGDDDETTTDDGTTGDDPTATTPEPSAAKRTPRK